MIALLYKTMPFHKAKLALVEDAYYQLLVFY